MEMVPSCKLMVYYVRKDKEVVVDTINFDVEDKLKNQVKVPHLLHNANNEFYKDSTEKTYS